MLSLIVAVTVCDLIAEVERKRQSTEPFMSAFISNFLSTLLVVPVSCHDNCCINIYVVFVVAHHPHKCIVTAGLLAARCLELFIPF